MPENERDLQDRFERKAAEFGADAGSLYALKLPKWLTGSAHASYFSALQKWLAGEPMPKGELIADVGCGPGTLLESWAPVNRVFGLDISPSLLRHASRRGFNVAAGSINALPYRQECFDRLCAFGVLVFARDPTKVLSDLVASVKPGGTVLVSAAVLGGVRTLSRTLLTLVHRGQVASFAPTFGRLTGMIESAGLTIERIGGITWPLPLGMQKSPGVILSSLISTAFVTARKLPRLP